jgi:hypothetical protein
MASGVRGADARVVLSGRSKKNDVAGSPVDT